MTHKSFIISLFAIFLFSVKYESFSQYSYVVPREPRSGEIPVREAGSFDIPGATYILVENISSPASTIFLGKDVTLDLNGYTISYAAAKYGHVANYGFEDGLVGWDVSGAPGATVEKTAEVRPFIGRKLLRLEAGDEIVSSYVYLPEAGRSYYAICGITGNYYSEVRGDPGKDMHVSIFVEDSLGNDIRVITRYADSTRLSCPVINRSARLGGGFVFAHLNNLPAGHYRIRVRAETDCLVDEIDIRPAMDVGVGIVGKTSPLGHYDHLYNIEHVAFFDYTANVSTGEALEGIPRVRGKGTVIIRNGTILNGTKGVLSWGIQSTADDVKVIVDNVRFVSSGINTTAIDVPHATITNCRFEIDNPFIINRHGAQFYSVDLRGDEPSEVSFSEFYGGQGNLVIKGNNSIVHNNIFVNRQTVTNHYSVMAMGDGSRIFENIFRPEIGSGIEIYRHRNIEIFNNEFHIKAAPPSCEYHLRYSTNAIRIADYGADPGSPRGAYGNRVYNNRFYIKGKKFKEYPDYIPVANALFYSASGGENEVFGNEIYVYQENPDTDAEAFAFYIGNSRGGKIYNNLIVSNVSPFWVGCPYGRADYTKIAFNSVCKDERALNDFSPVKMGSLQNPGSIAYGADFRSNTFTGMDFKIDATDQNHKYSVYWTLGINLYSDSDEALIDTSIVIRDKDGNLIAEEETGTEDFLEFELIEYQIEGNKKISFSPYTIHFGNNEKEVYLNKNTLLKLKME